MPDGAVAAQPTVANAHRSWRHRKKRMRNSRLCEVRFSCMRPNLAEDRMAVSTGDGGGVHSVLECARLSQSGCLRPTEKAKQAFFQFQGSHKQPFRHISRSNPQRKRISRHLITSIPARTICDVKSLRPPNDRSGVNSNPSPRPHGQTLSGNTSP